MMFPEWIGLRKAGRSGDRPSRASSSRAGSPERRSGGGIGALYFASDESARVTGSVFSVDGGLVAG